MRTFARQIAAPGIADRRGLAAAFALGFEGVQIGTAFLPAQLLVPARRTFIVRGNGTDLTEAFTGRWGERNQESADERIQRGEQSATAISCPTCSDPNGCYARIRSGSFGAHDNLAGQNASLCHSTDATEFMTQLIAEAETAFSKYWDAVSAVRETRDEDEA